MRALNDIERDLVSRLTAGNIHLFPFAGLIDHLLIQVRISISFRNRTAEFLLEDNPVSRPEFETLVDNILLNVITAINLIDYLHREGYVLLIQSANTSDDPFVFGRGITNWEPVHFPFPDNSIANLLINMADKSIVVTQPLIDFVHNDFKTIDEVRHLAQIKADRVKHEQAMKVAWGSICVSIILGLTSFVLTLVNDTKIDKEQFNRIEKKYDQIGNGLKTIGDGLTSLKTDRQYAEKRPKKK